MHDFFITPYICIFFYFGDRGTIISFSLKLCNTPNYISHLRHVVMNEDFKVWVLLS